MQLTHPNPRRGFTLVELLVVIVILSLLAALGARAVFSAINSAKEATIKIEMTQILQQLSLMKDKFGSYPPSDPASAAAYVQQMSRHVADPADEVLAFDDTAKALTFWLGGVSRDPASPMKGLGTKDFQFEFNADQLPGDGTYRPPGEALSTPYRY
ncbi:MAG: type II secretion system GspH family protein, partial [Pirellulales bacterium]|nr:type II secretion system GspH family protein [Pirellulales bacterium]